MIVSVTTYVRCWLVILLPTLLFIGGGCAAFRPLHGIPARYVPEELQALPRAGKRTIDLSLLSQTPPPHYLVDSGDVLAVYIEGILPKREEGSPVYVPGPDQQTPGIGVPITVRDDGTISLPLVGTLVVRNRTIPDVEVIVRRAYTGKLKDNQEFLNPGRERILVSLQKPRLYRVLVLRQEGQSIGSQVAGSTFSLGELKRGTGKTVALPAYKNDVLHALAETGGLPGLDAENAIYVIRGKNPLGLDRNDCNWNTPNSAKHNARSMSPLVVRAQSPDQSFWQPGIPAPGSLVANEFRRTQYPAGSVSVDPSQNLDPRNTEQRGPHDSFGTSQPTVVTGWGRPQDQNDLSPSTTQQVYAMEGQQQGMPIQPPLGYLQPAGGYGHQAMQRPAPEMTPSGNLPVMGNPYPQSYPQSLPQLSRQPIPHPGSHSSPHSEELPPPAETGAVDPFHGVTNVVKPRKHMIRIPIRLGPDEEIDLTEDDIKLDDGDIIFIESRDTEIFYTGGLLGGGQFPLPRDYDLDILGAIAISQGRFAGGAGGTKATQSVGGQSALNADVSISASTAIVLRPTPDGQQVPIRVDLYRALRNPSERILIQPGDYIMLQYTPAEATLAFFERHLLEGALFGIVATQLNSGGN